MYCRVLIFESCLPPQLGSDYVVVTNPPVSGAAEAGSVIGTVVDLLPKPRNPKLAEFVDAVGFLAGAVQTAATVVECGYETGTVTVLHYQSKSDPDIVGTAVIFHGTLANVFVQTSKCYLGKQLFGSGYVPTPVTTVALRLDPPTTDPAPIICDATHQTVVFGGRFTVLTIGSTPSICAALTGGPSAIQNTQTRPGSVTGTMRVDARVRATPAVAGTVLMTVGQGTTVTIDCYEDAGFVDADGQYGPSRRWARVEIANGTIDSYTRQPITQDLTGFAWSPYIDAGGDLAAQVPACSGQPDNAGPSSANPDEGVRNIAVGRCVSNTGTGTEPVIEAVDCAARNSYTVVKVAHGAGIAKRPDGQADVAAACTGVRYDNYYSYLDSRDSSQNFVLCLTRNFSVPG
jgi:hypothetical protein